MFLGVMTEIWRNPRKRLVLAVLTVFAVLMSVFPVQSFSTEVFPRSGSVDLAYSYPGSITNTDCSNPARGAGFYGDIFQVSSNSPAKIYMMEGTLRDPFLQILDSNRTSILNQDDDSGSDDNKDGASFSAYINTGAESVTSTQYVVATTYGAGGSGTYTLYSDVPLTQVTACPQVITFDPASSMTYGEAVNVTANTNMSRAVTLTSETTDVCDVETSDAPNFSIRATGIGICTIKATQAGDETVEAAPDVVKSITVSKRTLTLIGLDGDKNYDGTTTAVLTGTPALAGVYGDDDVSLSGTPTGSFNSANAGSRTITVSGLDLAGEHKDRYTLSATISGTIRKIDQTLTWNPNRILIPSMSGDEFSVNASTSGDGTIAYSVTNAGTTGCSISGTGLVFTDQGNCVVRVTASSTTNYNQATKDVSFTISKLNQVLTWAPNTSLAVTPTEQNFVPATSSGDGAVVYSVVSDGGSQCTVEGNTLKFWASGTCRVRATATGTIDFNEAMMEIDFIIPKAAQSVTWNPTNKSVAVTAASLKPNAVPVASGSGTVTYSVVNAGKSGCTVNTATGVVSFSKAGTCRVRATAAETPLTTAGFHEVEFVINPVAQTVRWSPSNTQADTSTTTLRPASLATSSGSGAISYSVVSAGRTQCSVDSRTAVITYGAAGACVVRATAAATDRETSAFTDVTFTFIQAETTATQTQPLAIDLRIQEEIKSLTGPTAEVAFDENGLPQLLPLQSIGLEDGRPIEILLVPNQDQSGLVLTGDGFEMSLVATGSDGSPQSLSSSGSLQLTGGNYAEFNGTGFAPDSEIDVWLFSDPTLLGQITTDADGNFAGKTEVPTDLPAGEHTVQLNGVTKDGLERSVAVGVELADASDSSSGRWLNVLLTGAGLFVLAAVFFGFVLLGGRRRYSGS